MPQHFPDRQTLLEQAIDRHSLVVPPDTPVLDAIASMSNARVSCVLIAQQQTLLGILTERDVVRLAAIQMPLVGVAISQVMTQNLVTLSLAEADTIFDVLALLHSSGIRHLPILDEQGNLLGVITSDRLAEKTQGLRQVNEQMQQVPETSCRKAASQHHQLLAQKLRTSESMMRAVFGAMTDIVLVIDTQRNIQVVPTNMSSPYEPGLDIIDHTVQQFFQDEGAEHWLQPVQRVLETQQTLSLDYSLPIGDRMLWFTACISPLSNDAAIWVARDISDRFLAESALRQKNQELANTLQELQRTQQELIQSEKMAALGQLIAGVAHEINTPLGAIRSSVENLTDFLTSSLEELPQFFQDLSPERSADFFVLLHHSLQQTITFSTKEKRQFKRALIRQLDDYQFDNSDTLADTLVDLGIYDDISPFLPLLQDSESQNILRLAYQLSSLQKSTRTIVTATERAAKVVFALKTYARYDFQGEKVLANPIDGLETVLTLYQNQLRRGVEAIRDYEPNLPLVPCYPDELNQVWTNLIHNALQAMESKGVLNIEVKRQDDYVQVRITDSGKGIPSGVMPRIFEPFFTTKPPGEGSGLGLQISRKIIEKHAGIISVESVPGQTTFTVLLPLHLEE
jgi:signal transduction histidine kinase/CBS domain-containing protein